MTNDEMSEMLKDILREIDRSRKTNLYASLYFHDMDRVLKDELLLCINYHINVMPRNKLEWDREESTLLGLQTCSEQKTETPPS